jgi:hypothetical protein
LTPRSPLGQKLKAIRRRLAEFSRATPHVLRRGRRTCAAAGSAMCAHCPARNSAYLALLRGGRARRRTGSNDCLHQTINRLPPRRGHSSLAPSRAAKRPSLKGGQSPLSPGRTMHVSRTHAAGRQTPPPDGGEPGSTITQGKIKSKTQKTRRLAQEAPPCSATAHAQSLTLPAGLAASVWRRKASGTASNGEYHSTHNTTISAPAYRDLRATQSDRTRSPPRCSHGRA